MVDHSGDNKLQHQYSKKQTCKGPRWISPGTQVYAIMAQSRNILKLSRRTFKLISLHTTSMNTVELAELLRDDAYSNEFNMHSSKNNWSMDILCCQFTTEPYAWAELGRELTFLGENWKAWQAQKGDFTSTCWWAEGGFEGRNKILWK